MHVSVDAATTSWEMRAGATCLVLRLVAGSLMTEHLGSAASRPRTFDRPPPPGVEYGQQLLRGRRDGDVLVGGDRSPVPWRLVSWSPRDHGLDLELHGVDAPLALDASWRFSADGTSVTRRSTVRHRGGAEPVTVTSAVSGAFAVPGVSQVLTLHGWWARETRRARSDPGAPLLLESRSGKTGFEHAPYAALFGDGRATAVQVAWPGNWSLHCVPLWDGRVHVSGGLNPWGLRHVLAAGDHLRLPDVLVAHVEGGLDEVTHALHDARRRRRVVPSRPIPVQFNSWYPYPGPLQSERVRELVRVASRLECETFVVDAGWHRNEGSGGPHADDWLAGMGDWLVDPAAFPEGLPAFADFCRTQGLDVGLWFEPENAGITSWLRRERPAWMHHVPGFTAAGDRNAAVHLGVPEARAEVARRIVERLTEVRARWVKWDMNQNLWEGGWHPHLPPEVRRRDPLVAHYEGLAALQDELARRFPDMVLEMCASGGGRFDAESMSRAHTSWMSDQSDPLMNLAIHFGSQVAHPPEECNDWLVEWPPFDTRMAGGRVETRPDLAFRTEVAMLGSFGVSAPVQRWSEDDIETVRRRVRWYRDRIRPILPTSRQYLVTDQPGLHGEGDWAAMWYAARDGRAGSLAVFRLESPRPEVELALPGLDPTTRFDLVTPHGPIGTVLGRDLEAGLSVRVPNRFRSTLVSVVPA